MTNRMSEIPDTTEGLVELQDYLKECSTVTVMQLREEINEAAVRLMFLLDYAVMPCRL